MKQNYMLVVHYKFTDKIVNLYFETKEDMNQKAKELLNTKIDNYCDNEILHKFEIKEV